MPALWQQILAGTLGIAAILLIAWCGAHLHFGRREEAGNQNAPGRVPLPSGVTSASAQSVTRSIAQARSDGDTAINGERKSEGLPGSKPKQHRTEADKEARKQKRLQRLKSAEGAATEQKGPKRKEGETEEEYETRKQKRMERRLARQRAAGEVTSS